MDEFLHKAEIFDDVYAQLTKKINGEIVLQPESTVARLLADACSLQDEIEMALNQLRQYNERMETTLQACQAVVRSRDQTVDVIRQKIDKYTVSNEGTTSVLVGNDENKPQSPGKQQAASSSKQRAVSTRSDKKSKKSAVSEKKTPLKPVENISTTPLPPRSLPDADSDVADSEKFAGDTTVVLKSATPPPQEQSTLKDELSTSKQNKLTCVEGFQTATPRLTDYVPVDILCGMITDLSTTRKLQSTKKSEKKYKSTPDLPSHTARGLHSDFSTVKLDRLENAESTRKTPRLRAKRTLALQTPTRKGLDMEMPATPKLQDVLADNPICTTLPALPKLTYSDHTDRIPPLDVVDYHSMLQSNIKQLVSFELLNKVLEVINTLFGLGERGHPVQIQHLVQSITPVAGQKAQLCFKLLMKFKRLARKPEDSDLVFPVYSNELSH